MGHEHDEPIHVKIDKHEFRVPQVPNPSLQGTLRIKPRKPLHSNVERRLSLRACDCFGSEPVARVRVLGVLSPKCSATVGRPDIGQGLRPSPLAPCGDSAVGRAWPATLANSAG